MYCWNCGKEVSDEAYICTNCGCLVAEKHVVVQEVEQTNGIAIAGFVCSFITPLLGWIFGGIGLSRSAKRNGKGRKFSIAALAIATANCIIALAITII